MGCWLQARASDEAVPQFLFTAGMVSGSESLFPRGSREDLPQVPGYSTADDKQDGEEK